MRVRACALIERDGKILVLAYDYPGGRIHALPGGNIENDESPEGTIIREYREELGLEIAVGRLLYVGEMSAHGKIEHTLHLVFLGAIISGIPCIDPQHTKATDWLWLDTDRLAKVALYPAFNRAVMEGLDNDRPEGARYLGRCDRIWV